MLQRCLHAHNRQQMKGEKQGTYHKTELWYRKPRFNILLILFLYTSYFSAHILKYTPEDRVKNLMVLMATPIMSKTQQHTDIFNAQSLLWPRFFDRDFVFLALYAFVCVKCILSPWCYMQATHLIIFLISFVRIVLMV